MPKHLRSYALLFQSLFILPMAQANEWDWVPRESLSEAQQATLSQYCRGAYVDSWQVIDGDNTHLLADMIYRDEQGTLFMDGAATLRQPLSQLDADSIKGVPGEYYQAKGDVSLRAEGQIIRSDNAYISSMDGNQTAQFDNAKFLSHKSRIRGEAGEISRTRDGLIFIKEGFYTTCEPGENSWQLYGSSIELNPDSGFGTAKHVQIRIHDIPVFYFPWLRFPLDTRRQSGFLFPSFGISGKSFTLSAPYYLNLAPEYDATITPNLVLPIGEADRDDKDQNGQGIDIELRHLSRYGETQFEQSTFYDENGDEATLRKFTTDQRLTDSFGVGAYLEDNPTENRVPEANNTSIQEEDHYERRGYARYNLGNFSSNVQVRRFQTPDPAEDKPLEWLPRVSASYRYADTQYSYRPDIEFTDFFEPDKEGQDGQRAVLNQDFNARFGNEWGEITAGMLHQYRDYQLHDYDNDQNNRASVNHLSYYLDTSVVFERRFNGNWRQTLEPQMSYLYAPYEEQSDIPDFDANEMEMTYGQAFSHRRFSGNDRIGDTEQVALGLESRIYDDNNVNRWTLQGGQVFYLKDRKVGIDGNTGEVVDDSTHSAVLTTAAYNGDNFTLANHFNYDFDENRVDLAQSALKYTPDSGFVFNLSFSYLYDDNEDDMTKQSSFGTIIPINDNWHFFHQQSYDWVDREQTAQVEGFGYENCCIKTTFSYQRWRDNDGLFDEGVFIQFILRSLSGVGRTNSDIDTIADDYWNQGKVGY
ncbi:LPS-assembly protein LptD [Marinomonas fungiae]|uniref:LPS-assembly protein LptD n=1 Tax=Marinomonas fungiae TaxID=1137284 RepID=UPI003A8F10F0